jgi:hypothetical protein
VGFDVLTTCQPSTVWCSRERLPAAAAQPAKVRQSCSASDSLLVIYDDFFKSVTVAFIRLNLFLYSCYRFVGDVFTERYFRVDCDVTDSVLVLTLDRIQGEKYNL